MISSGITNALSHFHPVLKFTKDVPPFGGLSPLCGQGFNNLKPPLNQIDCVKLLRASAFSIAAKLANTLAQTVPALLEKTFQFPFWQKGNSFFSVAKFRKEHQPIPSFTKCF